MPGARCSAISTTFATRPGMTQQKLNRPQVARLLVDLRHLCPPHRMRAIGARLKTYRQDPFAQDARILPRRQMRTVVKTAGPEILQPKHFRIGDPAFERLACRFGDLKADRLARLALGNGGALLHPSGCENVPDLQADQVAASKLAVDSHVEQRQVASVVRHLQADPDRPDMFRQQRPLLTDDAPLVPGRTFRPKRRKKIDGHGMTSCPPAPP